MASLEDLGLSEYEARAYRALVRTGASTAKELSTVSDVPMGRIYDVLSRLENRGFVRTEAASQPKRYAAVDPETALDRLLTERREELRERAAEFEAAVEEVVADLDGGAAPVEEGFSTAAVGPAEVVDLVVERIRAAERRIVIVGTQPPPQFDVDDVGGRIVDELIDAVERGVEVAVLMTPALVRSVSPDLIERFSERLVDHPEFEARTAADVEERFYLFDRREVCVEVPHPLHPEETFALIDLADREFAADVRELFESRWEGADPLEL
ncbi:MAG: TrmB family transcriptional regulator [Halobacteriales archaeon]